MSMFAHTDESTGWLLRTVEDLPVYAKVRLALAMAGIAERNLLSSEVARTYAKLVEAERQAAETSVEHIDAGQPHTQIQRQLKVAGKTANRAGVG